MKDMEVDTIVASAGITVEEGGGWEVATLTSPESSCTTRTLFMPRT